MVEKIVIPRARFLGARNPALNRPPKQIAPLEVPTLT
jgi:hypothetical protein